MFPVRSGVFIADKKVVKEELLVHTFFILYSAKGPPHVPMTKSSPKMTWPRCRPLFSGGV